MKRALFLRRFSHRDLTPYQGVVLGDSPSGFWPLNETSTSEMAIDLSPNWLNGTYKGGVTLGFPGLPSGGTGALLDGSSGFVIAPLAFTSVASFSMEAWVNFNGSSALHGPFIEMGDGTNGYSFGCGTQNNTNPGAYDEGGVDFVSMFEDVAWNFPPSAVPIPTTGWHHVVLTVDTNSNSNYYLDGVYQGEGGSYLTPKTPTGNTYLGTD